MYFVVYIYSLSFLILYITRKLSKELTRHNGQDTWRWTTNSNAIAETEEKINKDWPKELTCRSNIKEREILFLILNNSNNLKISP